MRRIAGESAADPDALDAAVFQRLAQSLVSGGVPDLIQGGTSEHSGTQRNQRFVAFFHRLDFDAVHRIAVLHGDDHVLRNVDQLTRQIARVSRLQGGIGQTFTRAVRGDEVLQHAQTFAERRRDRALNDLA